MIEVLDVPQHVVAVAVGERSAQALQPDDVGVSAGMSEQTVPIPAGEDRESILDGAADEGTTDVEEPPGVVDDLAVDESPDDLHQSINRCLRDLAGP